MPPLDESNEEDLQPPSANALRPIASADCAGCHNQIDPPGLRWKTGPTGVWRDKHENGREVDVSNVLFTQHKFADFNEFKKLLVQQKPRFVRGFIAHLLSYALAASWSGRHSGARGYGRPGCNGDDQLRSILKAVP